MTAVTIEREDLEALADAAERRADSRDCGRGESRRLRDVLRVARAALAAVPRPVEGCVVGGCTAVGERRWPTLDGGTVPVCARHHDLAARYAESKGYDDEEALWCAREGRP
ncbi:MAG: hypothetical protein Q8S73_38510 [Deltaproteobacteria bacterium]|nr:hypothetical protein [Myxococcales bacterium]MDP3220057.1 hypothetical protein [Deltaproteobacteria bacterium]